MMSTDVNLLEFHSAKEDKLYKTLNSKNVRVAILCFIQLKETLVFIEFFFFLFFGYG